MIVPALEGRLVRLEPLAVSHAEALAEAAGERATYGWTSVPDGLPAMAAHIEELIADAGVVPFAQVRRADERPVGMTRYLTLRPHAVEIGGTWLAAGAQRTGINREAKLLLLEHAFTVLGVGRVDFVTDARNERSRNGIAGVGAKFEGILRGWQPSHVTGEEGRLRDSAMFSIVAGEWPAVRDGLRKQLGA